MKHLTLTASFLIACAQVFSQTTTFYDNFKTNHNNWLIINNTTLDAFLSPRGYTLHNKSKSNENAWHELPIDLSRDYTLEATITRDYKKDNYGFGVVFGGKDPGNVYEFFIEVTGFFTFFKYENFNYVSIIGWTPFSGINPIGKTNTIKIENRSGTLHFFVNGKEAGTYKTFKPFGSLYGFGVGQESRITVNQFKATYYPLRDPVVMIDSTTLPNHIILDEQFHDNHMQWDNHPGHSEVKNGYYELSNPGKDSYLFWEDYAMFKVHPFCVETEMQLINGLHISPYGLLLGIKGGAGDYLEFAITNNGFIRLTQHMAWEGEVLVPWKFCSSIKSNTPNKITVNRRNDSLYFYINHRLALKHADVKLSGNGVGWVLSHNIKKVHVNYLRIHQPLQTINEVADITATNRERLSDNINSPSEEFAPVISPDGTLLYFTRDDNPGITSLEKDDIWYSVYSTNQWSPATKMPAPLNNRGNSSVISVSPDNQTLLLRGDYDDDPLTSKEELCISHYTKNGWEKPTKVEIKNFQNKDRYEDFCLSANKTILLLSVENSKSIGERDIYVSFLQADNTWSEPLNLGHVVNTTSNDFSPFLAADNTTLYYSSFGFPSYGKADIYVTRRLDDTWQNWSPPQNLGKIINTELIDQDFVLAANGREAYLSSEENTIGKADIFKITLPPALQPQPVVLIYGKVYDSSTGQAMSTAIVYEDLLTEKEIGKAQSHVQTGDYKIILPYGEHYGINANEEGYLPLRENIDIVEKKSYQEIHLDLYLIPIRAGENIVMRNLFFAPGSPTIAMKSYSELRKMVTILKQYPTMQITIAGHTDDGSGEKPRYLQKLSMRRADAVKNYFMTHGIASERIKTVGYGKEKPLVPNASDEGRKKNRRVEFIIDAM